MNRRALNLFGLTLLMLATCVLPACTSLYYDTMETLGKHKRDLLVSRVVDARDDQEEAKDECLD